MGSLTIKVTQIFFSLNIFMSHRFHRFTQIWRPVRSLKKSKICVNLWDIKKKVCQKWEIHFRHTFFIFH